MAEYKGSFPGKNGGRDFPGCVKKKENNRIRARKHDANEVWFGLGMFGIVGWAVAVPTVIGIFIGIWIDLKWPSRYSWTLMLLVAGLGLGCFNAWHWIQRERRSITKWKENEQ